MNVGSGFQNVLVIGADALSRYVDWTDRGTCILFGDAAGAVLVQVIAYLPIIVLHQQQLPISNLDRVSWLLVYGTQVIFFFSMSSEC